jgi:hypothetical protein
VGAGTGVGRIAILKIFFRTAVTSLFWILGFGFWIEERGNGKGRLSSVFDLAVLLRPELADG